jgi:hypothetical protein
MRVLQIEYLYANLCKYFEANIKRMIRINVVCEYTETCEFEANKIYIRLESLRSEVKSFEYGAPRHPFVQNNL